MGPLFQAHVFRMRGTTSFTEIVKAQGKTPSSHLISYRRRPLNEQKKWLNLVYCQLIIIRMGIRYADKIPVVYGNRFLKNLSKISKRRSNQALLSKPYKSMVIRLVNLTRPYIIAFSKRKIAHYLELKKGMLF